MKRAIILIFMFLGSHFSAARSAEYQLQSIPSTEFQQVVPIIQRAIAPEDNKTEIIPFEISQTFALLKGGVKIGYLIPVKYNSKIFKNTICRLYFLGIDKRLSQTVLFAEKNDGDDIVPSCVGVEAVSTQETHSSKLLYLAVIRQRIINNYSSIGKIIGYKDGQLYDEVQLNECVRNAGPSSNIRKLKKEAILCQKELQQ